MSKPLNENIRNVRHLTMTSDGCIPDATLGQFRRLHGAPPEKAVLRCFDGTSSKCKVWRVPVAAKIGEEPVERLVHGVTGTVFDAQGNCLSTPQIWLQVT